MIFSFAGCTKWEMPPSIYDQSAKSDTTAPFITGFLPADSAIAGYREITIFGRNFPTDTSAIHIFFQDRIPVIKSLTSSQIVLYRPLLDANEYGIKLTIKVENPSIVAAVKNRPYQLEAPVTQFADLSLVTRTLSVMEFGKNDTLYAASSRYLYTITSDGAWVTQHMDQSLLGPDLAKITDMKFGPGGYLYCETGGSKRGIYRIDVVNKTKVSSPFMTLPAAAGSVAHLDFDATGKIYTAGTNGVFITDTSSHTTSTGHYNGNTITELRVINSTLYVAYGSVLSKNTIKSDGSLDVDQTVVDLSTIADLSSCTINSFNLDDAGTVYLALSYQTSIHPTYAIFVVESSQLVTPFYHDPDLLRSPVDQILWTNNSRYLYLNRSTTIPRDTANSGNYRLYRMGTLHNGAAYNGRNLH